MNEHEKRKKLANVAEKEDVDAMRVKLDGLQDLIQNGQKKVDDYYEDDKDEVLMNEMREKLEGLQLLVNNANDEYKRDYENLVEILNSNHMTMNEELEHLMNDKEQKMEAEDVEKLQINDKLKNIVDLLKEREQKE